MSTSTYEQSELNQGKRYAKRCKYDKELISSIIRATPLVHVSFNAPFQDDAHAGFPTILPMLGAMGTYTPKSAPGSFNNDVEPEAAIYLHGSSTARLSRLTSASAGLKVCISATKLDGYVLALTPFNHSCNYRSAVIFGHAQLVKDEDEILYAMELITNTMIPDRWDNSRTPPTKSEVTATGILRVAIESASAKVRTGMPHDDRKDAKDESLTARVWTGVVPVSERLEDPVASPQNRVEKLPGYIDGWVKQANARSQAEVGKSLEE
ncbi:hypothetical protein MBLNU457_1503t1 [Dothideomycetes sp. NU457]